MLNAAKAKALSADDWNGVMSIATQTLTVFKSVNKYLDSQDKFKDFSNVQSGAALVVSMAGTARGISDSQVHSPAQNTVASLNQVIDAILLKEAAEFEALGKRYEPTNKLEAAKAYKCAAAAYELLGNSKCTTCKQRFEDMVKAHDDLVGTANEIRVDTERALLLVEPELSNVGASKLLLNPFAYDEVSTTYTSAVTSYDAVIEKYGHAGEVRMQGDANDRLNEVAAEWKSISFLFSVYMLFLIVIFVLVVIRLSKGIADYQRDSREITLANVVNP